jgi:hypothetical protein
MKKKKLSDLKIELSSWDIFVYKTMAKYGAMKLPYNVYVDKVNEEINEEAKRISKKGKN